MQKSETRLNPKDLINIGIFTAIYFVIIFAVACLRYIPIFMPALTALCPLAGGIPFMLLATKVRKFGAMLIMVVILGLFYMAMGTSPYTLPLGVVTGLVAEFIAKSDKYRSAKKAVLAYGVWCVAIFGNLMPVFLARDAWYEKMISGGYGQEFADAYMRYLPDWIAPVLVAACFVFGILGGVIGRAVLKKHFARAGMV
jgi:energy-coupling factor transport system substrate-specific component